MENGRPGKFLRNAWAWGKWEMAWDWGRVHKIKTTEIAVLTGVFSCWKAAERYFPQKLESELKGRRRNTEFIFTRWPEIWAWMDVSVVKSSCLLVNVHPVSLKTQQFWPVGWPHQFCYFVKIKVASNWKSRGVLQTFGVLFQKVWL